MVYDESRWPFVVVTMPKRELSDDEFLEHLAEMAVYGMRGPRFGLVIDARLPAEPNASRRRLIAEQMDRAIERDGERCVGVVIVLDSPVKRAVFNTLQWLRRANHPLAAVSTPEEGLRWLAQQRRKQLLRPTSSRPDSR